MHLNIIYLVIIIGPVFAESQINNSTPDESKASQYTCQGLRRHYTNKVQLRIIVFTYNRPQSLESCLSRLAGLDLMGRSAELVVWVDRMVGDSSRAGNTKVQESDHGGNPDNSSSPPGLQYQQFYSENPSNESYDATSCDLHPDHVTGVDPATIDVLTRFHWPEVSVKFKVHSSHVGPMGQWLTTWYPNPSDPERVLFIEDDIDVSYLSYRWLNAIEDSLKNENYSLITLQDDYLMYTGHRKSGIQFKRPTHTSIFMFPVFEPWGLYPRPKIWADFINWYESIQLHRPNMDPSVDVLKLYSTWYRQGGQGVMWHMWLIRFMYDRHLYAVHTNIAQLHSQNRTMCHHRREKGLHFTGTATSDHGASSHRKLIDSPDDLDLYTASIPSTVPIYDADGSVVNQEEEMIIS